MARRPDVTRSESGLLTRSLVEPGQMRALAHPRRLDLIDLLSTAGPLTATQCAERLDDSPASCSYHLRQLARFGFVEEAGGGTGRARPWRYVPIGNRVPSGGSPAQRAAAEEFFAVIDSRNADKLRRYRAAGGSDPSVGRGDTSDYAFLATAEELEDLVRQVNELFGRFQQRTFDGAAPDGAQFVDIVSLIMPRPRTSDA